MFLSGVLDHPGERLKFATLPLFIASDGGAGQKSGGLLREWRIDFDGAVVVPRRISEPVQIVLFDKIKIDQHHVFETGPRSGALLICDLPADFEMI